MSEHKGNNKGNRWKRVRDWAKQNSSFTDWCIALFTVVLAVAAIYQFIIMGGQLDEMRKDQRPWVSVSFSSNADLHANTPISAMLSIVNKGKTPARAIKGDVAIDLVKNGEEPQLKYPLPHARFTTGLIFPGDPYNMPIEGNVVTQREFDDFQNGRLFFVAYTNVSYNDFFGIEHWTKYCTAIVSKTANSFTGKNCTNYGDVDTN